MPLILPEEKSQWLPRLRYSDEISGLIFCMLIIQIIGRISADLFPVLKFLIWYIPQNEICRRFFMASYKELYYKILHNMTDKKLVKNLTIKAVPKQPQLLLDYSWPNDLICSRQ